jgi:hypothetical protein
VTYRPLEPIRRDEPAVKRVDAIPRVRLLTPAEREQAKREREERRRKRGSRVEGAAANGPAQEPERRADHQA